MLTDKIELEHSLEIARPQIEKGFTFVEGKAIAF